MKRKMIARILMTALLMTAMLALLTGCDEIVDKVRGGTKEEIAEKDAAEEIMEEEPLVAEVEDDGKYHIGILTYRNHGAAQETVDGFKRELTSAMGSHEVIFDEKDAGGDELQCAKIATDFANAGYDLIFACGTEAVQNAGASVHDVPIIGGCVSDFLMSEVISSMEAPGGNITGVTCLGPIDEQIDQVMRVSTWPVTVGIISSGVEIGSRFQESVAGQCIQENDASWIAYHAATEEGLQRAMKMASEECSCIYLPIDNFVAEHMDIVRDAVLETGIPVMTGDYQMCSRGGLCCVSIDYYEHGKKAADMAYDVLEKGEEISRMAIRQEESWQQYYNPEIAEAIGWYNYGGMTPLELSAQEDESAQGDGSAQEDGSVQEDGSAQGDGSTQNDDSVQEN